MNPLKVLKKIKQGALLAIQFNRPPQGPDESGPIFEHELGFIRKDRSGTYIGPSGLNQAIVQSVDPSRCTVVGSLKEFTPEQTRPLVQKLLKKRRLEVPNKG